MPPIISRDPQNRVIWRGGASTGRPRALYRLLARPPADRRASTGCLPGPATVADVRATRQCTRPTCQKAAAATLTYVYADSTAVLGPLATTAEPHSYDLCATHAERFTAPRGWEVVRLAPEFIDQGPSEDDLMALADAVREAGRPREPQTQAPLEPSEPRRGHLRVVR